MSKPRFKNGQVVRCPDGRFAQVVRREYATDYQGKSGNFYIVSTGGAWAWHESELRRLTKLEVGR
ncbi:MAG: hypothetical protein L0Z53_09060 [Acidobacteriales bacterium]|nr:hypothetical protein [Terriglobales bacterium]